ncbi:MAG: IS200/IS605 family transposase [Terriglobales bacterium]
MAHAYARNYVHLVFGTKGRRAWIKAPLQQLLWTYLGGIAREYGIEVLAIGGGEDHVHLLLCLPPKLSVAAIIRALKANSSKWMNEQGHLFAWQQGYGSFSVSSSNVNEVAKYIREQGDHHRRRDFREEFLALLRRHQIPFTSEHVLG